MILDNVATARWGGKKVKTLHLDGRLIWNVEDHEEPEVTLPDYWLECAQASLTRAKNNRKKMSSDRVEFIFFCDSHWGHNAKNSPKLVKWFQQQLGDMPVLFAGDIIESEKTTHDAAVKELTNFVNAFGYGTLFCTQGNHDNNDSTLSPSASNWMTRDRVVTNSELYDIVLSQNLCFPNSHNITELVSTANKNNGDWFDDETHKVRFIQFHFEQHNRTSWNTASRTYLRKMLETMPDDYRAIAMCHGNQDNIIPLESFEFGDEINKLKLIVGGHVHSYNQNEQTVNGHTIQMFTDRADRSTYDKTSSVPWGTSCTEQNIDIVQVDFGNKKVYKVNVGWTWADGDATLNIYD